MPDRPSERNDPDPPEEQPPADEPEDVERTSPEPSAPEPSAPEPPSLGASLRRLAQAAGEAADAGIQEASRQALRAAEAARPEAERLAKQAKSALDAARPHAERAASQARDYVVEHEDELKRAAGRGARIAADAATPRVLRPAVRAAEDELRKPKPTDEDTVSDEDDESEGASDEAPRSDG